MQVEQQEPIQLIRHAMAKHIKEVAQELLYWMEELNKLDHEGVETATPPAQRTGVHT